MKYLGIDYGSKRIGLAVSDEAGSFAFPLKVLSNSENLIKELVEICRENNVEGVVVGESKDYLQKDNEIMDEILPFVEDLKNVLNLPIYMHPEFLTSQEAERLQGKNDMHDASAAALILKSYLDSSAH
ncbi:MAG: RuvX/YqgF family protein [Candidatus Paceibacterota bacterium]|jgi:putative Holliday junction resolvase